MSELTVGPRGTLCRNGGRPVVMVFVRTLNPRVRQLLRNVDRIVDANKTLWNKPLDGVKVVGADDALKQGCRTFVIASLTYAKEMRAVISAAASKQGVDLRVFEMTEAA